MGLEVVREELNGLMLIRPKVFEDERGFFLESYQKKDFSQVGITKDFVQDNHSRSQKNVLRGLHFQWDKPLSKLVRVTRGKAIFVELDIRKKSKTFGEYRKFELSERNKLLLWVPYGFANSFLSLEDNTEVQYKCDEYWNKQAEAGIMWNDPQINIDWGVDEKEIIVSQKDRSNFLLEEWVSNPNSDFIF